MKKASGNEICEEGVVRGDDFAFQAEAVFAGGFADQIVSHVAEGGEVGGRMFGADSAFVVAEDHIHDPMEAVLDRPMAADDGAETMSELHQWARIAHDVSNAARIRFAGLVAHR